MENDTIRSISHKISRYDTIRCISATSNLMHERQFVNEVCCYCCSGCEPGRYSRTTIAAKPPTRAHAQTISNGRWLEMLTGDNAIWAPATLATLLWWPIGRQLYMVAHDRRRCKQLHTTEKRTAQSASCQVSVRQSRSTARWRIVILQTHSQCARQRNTRECTHVDARHRTMTVHIIYANVIC